MRAALLTEYNSPLILAEVPKPEIGPEDVLIEVETCGLCHSDLHLAQGDWPQLLKVLKLPVILGHEVVGKVVARGAMVLEPQVGARVGVPWIHWTCGACEFCNEGRENLCLKQKITGASVDGGFAEFIIAPASHVAPVPDNLSAAEAAPLFCAGVTVFRALRNSGIQKGQRIAIFGVGGLGHYAIQIAKHFGAQVTAVDVREEKLDLARELGADQVLNASKQDPRKELRSKGGVHYAMVTSAAKSAYDTALGCLRRGATILVVGVPAEDLTFPGIVLIGGEYRILSSAVGTRDDLREVLRLAAEGKIRGHVQERPLSDINVVLDEMRRGDILGRVALRISD